MNFKLCLDDVGAGGISGIPVRESSPVTDPWSAVNQNITHVRSTTPHKVHRLLTYCCIHKLMFFSQISNGCSIVKNILL